VADVTRGAGSPLWQAEPLSRRDTVNWLVEMSFALEVHPVPVRLIDFVGRQSTAEIFLRSVGERHPGPERLLDRLNDPAADFMAATVEGRIELFQLSWIACVEVEGRAPELSGEELPGATTHRVELELVGGRGLEGELVYARPAGQSRVSDFLNATPDRFFPLVFDDRTCYVNRRAVVRVRP
jgi:hypothetical protein